MLSLAALGVVYGDIGTSPLYAVRECFHGEYGITPTPAHVLGVLSCMVWSLLLIVTGKYLFLILRADNHGEGGVIALTALVRRVVGERSLLVLMGLFAAALLYGDGMITPAISVLSAVEGLHVLTPGLQPYVIPTTVAILVALFALQRRGTAGIGALFGPVTLLWLVTIALLGLGAVWQRPGVLAALAPWYALQFLANGGTAGFMVLGAVFLVVTGAEALYADLGHFGRRPIRTAWLAVVLPALLCNYLGQGALLLADPGLASNPFYALAPRWMLVPLVVLATMATIIASQAVISGAFSLTRQAVQLGYLPRLRVIHTSDTERGQVFSPPVNALLMCCTIGLVLGFGSSSKLAAAYGVAVTTTMLVATVLIAALARWQWRWRLRTVVPLTAVLLTVDFTFFGANIGKLAHGAWFPLLIGLAIFLMFTTWHAGRAALRRRLDERTRPLDAFVAAIAEAKPARTAGRAVYLSGRPDVAPPALVRNWEHNGVLHAQITLISVSTADTPRVPRAEKVAVRDLGEGIYQILARVGFAEEPNAPYLLALAREQGLDVPLEELTFFLGRETLVADRHSELPTWRRHLFTVLSRNALDATAFFHLPPAQVVEFGTQIEI